MDIQRGTDLPCLLQLSMIGLNQNAIEYMHMLGFRDVVLIAERFTT